MEKSPRTATSCGRKRRAARQAEIEYEGKASLKIWQRCEMVGRRPEYDSLYALFCLDTHNNASALAERHLSEAEDGSPLISFFGEYDPKVVASRLDFGLQFLLQAARMIHGAIQEPAPESRRSLLGLSVSAEGGWTLDRYPLKEWAELQSE